MKILITRPIANEAMNALASAGIETIIHLEDRNLTAEELIDYCRSCDGLISAGPNVIDESFLSANQHLKGIALLSAGYDRVDLSAATHYGIPISNTPDVLTNATADTAFLLMLSVSRNAQYMNQRIKDGKWDFYQPMADLGQELYGKTLGIFGLGRIGSNLAMKCKTYFQMKLIYHNRSRNEALERETGAKFVPFNQLLSDSDVLSVHSALTKETKGIFDLNVFRKMKRNAIFINTARGGIHQEEDLVTALGQHLIWGAGLDVTNPEPMSPNNPLLRMNNVCVLPHIGSATVEARTRMSMLAVNNIIAALRLQRMPQILNEEVYT